jgi:hypothetical protein
LSLREPVKNNTVGAFHKQLCKSIVRILHKDGHALAVGVKFHAAQELVRLAARFALVALEGVIEVSLVLLGAWRLLGFVFNQAELLVGSFHDIAFEV